MQLLLHKILNTKENLQKARIILECSLLVTELDILLTDKTGGTTFLLKKNHHQPMSCLVPEYLLLYSDLYDFQLVTNRNRYRYQTFFQLFLQHMKKTCTCPFYFYITIQPRKYVNLYYKLQQSA